MLFLVILALALTIAVFAFIVYGIQKFIQYLIKRSTKD